MWIVEFCNIHRTHDFVERHYSSDHGLWVTELSKYHESLRSCRMFLTMPHPRSIVGNDHGKTGAWVFRLWDLDVPPALCICLPISDYKPSQLLNDHGRGTWERKNGRNDDERHTSVFDDRQLTRCGLLRQQWRILADSGILHILSLPCRGKLYFAEVLGDESPRERLESTFAKRVIPGGPLGYRGYTEQNCQFYGGSVICILGINWYLRDSI